MTFVGALFLRTVHWNLRRIHVQDRAAPRIQRLRISDQCPAEARKAGEVRNLGQYRGLETLHPRGKSDAAIPDLFRTDQQEGRILEKALGVVKADFRKGVAAFVEKRKAEWGK